MDIASAFKLFDIRGNYPDVVDERLAFLVAKCLAIWKRPRQVLVASDTRESSPSLKNFLIDGFSSQPVPVFDLFEVPAPQFHFTLATGNFDLGIMVTASHISDLENGFKISNAKGLPFDQSEISHLKNLVISSQKDPIVVPRIEAKRINTTNQYVKDILARADKKTIASKIILDATKSSVLTPVMVIFSRLAPHFQMVKSNHTGNPLLPENRVAIAEAIRQNQADLGIMWDSDGDRVIFVDRQGKLIPPSFILGILAAQAVSHAQGATRLVAIDVRAGLVVRDLVEQASGKIVVLPAWSPFIKFAMRENKNIVFGGETSGHYIFSDFYNIDDGILAAIRFLTQFEEGQIESRLAKLNRKYFELPEKNFPYSPHKAPQALQKLTEYYRNLGCQVSIEDGLTVFGPDYKFNLRESLTEPLLRLNLEARNAATAQQIVESIEEKITEIKSSRF